MLSDDTCISRVFGLLLDSGRSSHYSSKVPRCGQCPRNANTNTVPSQGGSGAGDAPFPPWFTNSTTDPQPYNIAHAWKLQYELVSQTPQRVKLSGNSSNGFAALAGASPNKVQVFLNNYQLNYDIAREIANGTVPYLNASTSAYPLIQENGCTYRKLHAYSRCDADLKKCSTASKHVFRMAILSSPSRVSCKVLSISIRLSPSQLCLILRQSMHLLSSSLYPKQHGHFIQIESQQPSVVQQHGFYGDNQSCRRRRPKRVQLQTWIPQAPREGQ